MSCASFLLPSPDPNIAALYRSVYNHCLKCLSAQVKIPLYGCDCYAYGLLSAGFCDLVIEADMKPYDYLALVPIVEGAGGIMTDWKVNVFFSSDPEGLP